MQCIKHVKIFFKHNAMLARYNLCCCRVSLCPSDGLSQVGVLLKQ